MGQGGSRMTTSDVLGRTDLTGKVAIVTGANTGIGYETVKALSRANASVYMTSRDVAKGEQAAERMKGEGAKGKIDVIQVDLSDLTSVKKGAEEIKSSVQNSAIDYVICNAGVMACPQAQTAQGFDWQLGVNVYGHYYLVHLLEDKLKQQGTPCRIVSLSSAAHGFADLDIDDLHFKNRKYTAWGAYGQSKMGNLLWAKELSSRYKGSNLEAFSVHPGVVRSDLWRHSGLGSVVHWLGIPFTKSTAQGAATSIYAAVEPSLAEHGGAYLEDCHIGKELKKEAKDPEVSKRFYDTMAAQVQAAVAPSEVSTA